MDEGKTFLQCLFKQTELVEVPVMLCRILLIRLDRYGPGPNDQ